MMDTLPFHGRALPADSAFGDLPRLRRTGTTCGIFGSIEHKYLIAFADAKTTSPPHLPSRICKLWSVGRAPDYVIGSGAGYAAAVDMFSAMVTEQYDFLSQFNGTASISLRQVSQAVAGEIRRSIGSVFSRVYSQSQVVFAGFQKDPPHH